MSSSSTEVIRGFASIPELRAAVLASDPEVAQLRAELAAARAQLALQPTVIPGQPTFVPLADVIAPVVENQRLKAELAEAKEAAKLADGRATTDRLTGIGNLEAFERRLRTLARFFDAGNEGDVTMLSIDVIGFKHVNDHYSQEHGDSYLKDLAKSFDDARHTIGTDVDVHVFRTGGDEFTIVAAKNVGKETRHAYFAEVTKIFREALSLRLMAEEASRGHLQPDKLRTLLQPDGSYKVRTMRDDAFAIRYGVTVKHFDGTAENALQLLKEQRKAANVEVEKTKAEIVDDRRAPEVGRELKDRRQRYSERDHRQVLLYGDAKELIRDARSVETWEMAAATAAAANMSNARQQQPRELGRSLQR